MSFQFFVPFPLLLLGFTHSSVGKNLFAMQETWVRLLGWEDSPGEGNGNPLQHSCLENPMNRAACQATVHGVAKSDMTQRLNHRHSFSYSHYIYVIPFVSLFLDILFFSIFSLFFKKFIYLFFISWRLITLQYCSGFCHILTRISHGFTCIPHPESPSHLPLHPIPLGLPSAPGPSTCLMHPTWAGDLFHPR